MNHPETIAEAFFRTVEAPVIAGRWYVTLYRTEPFYGGPEEGGWWGEDHFVIAFKVFPSEAAAWAAREATLELAEKLNKEARDEFGNYCLRQWDWLEERGLDSDFLGEVDGETRFGVAVTDYMIENTEGCRHYE
jgi:hypothetical protein